MNLMNSHKTMVDGMEEHFYDVNTGSEMVFD